MPRISPVTKFVIARPAYLTGRVASNAEQTRLQINKISNVIRFEIVANYWGMVTIKGVTETSTLVACHFGSCGVDGTYNATLDV